MPKYTAIFLFVTLSGCAQFQIGNGLFFITGNLANYANERCSLEVLNNSNVFMRVIYPRPITGVFQERYRVSDAVPEYRIRVICNNIEIHQRRVRYPGTLGYGGTVSLGLLR